MQEQLELVFGELEDPVLEGVTLLGVEQEPGGRTLRALLLVPSGRESGEVHAHLDGVRGRLRAEIAAAIHRKRTPQLGFVLIPADALRARDSEADDDA